MVDPSEGMSAADAGGGRGQPAQEAEAVLRAAVSPVQEEDAACSPQPGAGPAQRGKNCTFHVRSTEAVFFKH